MRVICTQYIDGIQHDEPREVQQVGGGPAATLTWKARRAAEDGWTVVWRSGGLGFTATRRWGEGSYREKVRVFEIAEG